MGKARGSKGGKSLQHRGGPKPPAMKQTPASSTTGGKQAARSKKRATGVKPSAETAAETAVEAVQSASPPWDSLPAEVVAEVFSTLRAGDVGAAACVCSAWKAVADQDQKVNPKPLNPKP
jgi:hypothetical protein